MSQNQKLDLSLRGLYTSPNNLSGIPEGALEIADNLVINSKNLIESRRGQTQYGNPLPVGDDQVNKLFNYKNSLIVNYADKMAYDVGDGVWSTYAGDYVPPNADFKMRSLEASGNFYFTTRKGVYKLDALGATPVRAGVPRALGGTTTLTGVSGFLVDDSAVAFRIVYGYTDANNNLILGAPSQIIIASNSSGGSRNVLLKFLIPDGIAEGYFYQIYRSEGTATATDTPSDELQLVIQNTLSSGEISGGSVNVIDNVPYALMSTTLYTSPSQEGIANANVEPPLCVDMDVFKGCVFYANVTQKQTLVLTLLDVDTNSPTSFGYATGTGNATTGVAAITALATTANIRVGMRVLGSGLAPDTFVAGITSGTAVSLSKVVSSGGTGVAFEFQDRLTIAGTDYYGGSTENIPGNQFKVSTGGSIGLNIFDTAYSIVTVVNASASNTSIYGYYISANEDLPGRMSFEEREFGSPAFYATSTAGPSFQPTLPVSGTTVSSANDQKQNQVMISKPNQPEAVPIYRFFQVGSANFPIQRVVALRDGVFFFKQDGIYRLSGETFESFIVTLLDNTVVLIVPESAVPFNNQVFCFTTQGVVAVTDSGVQIMSIPIENTLLRLSSAQYTNFVSASFGVAYESARLYMFFTITETTDVYANQAFVYNSLTDSWTRWTLERTCGIVNPNVNKLFMAQPDTGQVMIERKTYTEQDYADEQFNVTIVSIDSETEITLADAITVSDGMTLVQNNRRYYVVDVEDDVVTLDTTESLETGAAIVYQPIENQVQWTPIDCENPGILKQFSEISLMFRNAAFRDLEIGFYTNISPGLATSFSLRNNIGGWGQFPWGDAAWGGGPVGQNVIRTYVPREKQRASWLNLYVLTAEAFNGFALQGVSIMFNPMSPRIK